MLIVKHGDSAIDALRNHAGFRQTALFDRLHWGPQHEDIRVELTLRVAHHRDDFPRADERTVLSCAKAVEEGEELGIWCERTLDSALAVLRLVQWLEELPVDLQRVTLVLSPGFTATEFIPCEAVHPALEQRLPLAPHLPQLLALRRHIASESGDLDPDLSSLPEVLQKHFDPVTLLRHFLPDRKGLDVIDAILLALVSDEWQRALDVIVAAMRRIPQEYNFGDLMIWERLLELTGLTPRGHHFKEDLLEARFESECAMQTAQLRLSELGFRVRDKRTDAIKHRQFFRWVGGRLLTNEHLQRR